MAVSLLLDRPRLPVLDGIRGLAIGLVLLWHGVFNALVHIPNHPDAANILALGRLTWSGVDLFFVLSGFLIGGILLDAVEAKRYFIPFYVRRAHRILPLYGVVLAISFLASYIVSHIRTTNILVENRIPLFYYCTFLQNLWTANHRDFGSYTLGVTWSLAIEEQFYLTLPVIIRYVSRSRLWWIVGGMVATAPLLRIVVNNSPHYGPLASYVLMPCRLDALGYGVLAALILRTPRLWETIMRARIYLYLAVGGMLLVVTILLFSRFKPFTNQILGFEYSLLDAFYFLFLLSVLINGRLDAALSGGILRYMGTIAYGLYLLHVPSIVVVSIFFAWMRPVPSGWITLAGSIVGIGLATAMAAISWEYLEKPLIKRGHRWRYGNDTPVTSFSINGKLQNTVASSR